MTPLTTRVVGTTIIQEAPLAEIPPPQRPGVPQTVTMGQAKLALHDAGLLVHVDAAIEAMPEPQRTRALLEWNARPTVDRDSPLVAQLGAMVGLDDPALDALFTTAATL